MRVLVVNTGSSSLKLSVLTQDGSGEAASTVERWEGRGQLEPVRQFLDRVERIDALGHRVVHGGPQYSEAARIDGKLIDYLESISHLAPLHNPRSVAGIRGPRWPGW